MRIEGLRKFRGRNPHGYFEDLPWEVRQQAQTWLYKFCARWRYDLPPWRLARLVGQARRLARTTAEQRSAWGRKMLAKRGGYAVQRRYRAEGRTGPLHPAHYAAIVGASKRGWKKTVKERELQDIKPSRHGFTDLTGI
jgi:hypothetical protein